MVRLLLLVIYVLLSLLVGMIGLQLRFRFRRAFLYALLLTPLVALILLLLQGRRIRSRADASFTPERHAQGDGISIIRRIYGSPGKKRGS